MKKTKKIFWLTALISTLSAGSVSANEQTLETLKRAGVQLSEQQSVRIASLEGEPLVKELVDFLETVLKAAESDPAQAANFSSIINALTSLDSELAAKVFNALMESGVRLDQYSAQLFAMMASKNIPYYEAIEVLAVLIQTTPLSKDVIRELVSAFGRSYPGQQNLTLNALFYFAPEFAEYGAEYLLTEEAPAAGPD